MCERKHFDSPFVLHNKTKTIVKYVNFGGEFGFNGKIYIDIDNFKFYYVFLLLLFEK